MMLPELLHTSGSGLIMYMFESLCLHLGGGIDQDYIDQEHIVVSNIIQRQSECDFPCGLMRNGLIDGTKIQSSKRKGSLFQFLCIAHRTKAKTILKNSLQLSEVRWRKFTHFLKINPIDWEVIQHNFIVETQLGTNFHVSFVIVPIDSIVDLLCVFPDDGSNQKNKYFVLLPKRNWSRYFGNNIFFIKERHVHK